MRKTPLYEAEHVPKELSSQGNAGLWWDKFFHFYENDFSKVTPAVTQKDYEKPDGKMRWICTVEGERGHKQHIERFAQRQFELGAAQNAQQRFFKTDWHFATGLGYSHPVKNGFCWHHTLGVPYLPASGIKGLLRAWVEKWEEFDDEELRKKVLLSWFGSEPGEAKHEEQRAGGLIFFDAIPVHCPDLSADVTTPHMGKWYAEGSKISRADGSGNDAARIPGDWHSPVPIPFLVVSQASFLFQIAARSQSTFEEDYDLAKSMELLQLALEHLGAGAKTAACYGRMSEDTETLQRWEKRHEQEIRKLARQKKSEAKKKERAAIQETEEIVVMIEQINFTNKSVKVRTATNEEVTCTGAPVSFEAAQRLESPDEDDRKLNARITRDNGVITKVQFIEWI